MMKFRLRPFFFSLILSLVVMVITGAIRQEKRNSDSISLIFVFNQPKYAAGDTAYFTSYLFSPETELPATKQIATVKLLGADKQVALNKRIMFNDGISAGQFQIPESATPGIYALIVYPEKISAHNEELIPFSTEFIIAGRHLFNLKVNEGVKSTLGGSQPLDITLSQNQFGTRQEVELKIKLNNSINEKAKVSIAVFKEELFSLGDTTGSASVLTFRSGTTPPIAQKGQPSASPFFFKGKAILKSSGTAVPDLTRITFYLNRNDFVYPVTTAKDGYFIFPLFMNFGDEEVFYSMTSKGVPLQDAIIVLDEQKLQTNLPTSVATEIVDAYATYAHQKKTILKSYQYYTDRQEKDNSDSERREFTDSDIEVDLRKYESFNSMSEVLMNVVPMVKIKKADYSDAIRIFLESKATYADQDPLFIIDGVMTNNTNYILKLIPDQITKIGVLRTKQTLARFGDLGVNGIIAIETTHNHNIKLERTEKSLMITGISSPVEYPRITHSTESGKSKVPNLRASLYWNPQIELQGIEERTVSFFTSDDSGYYIIQASGILDNKSPFIQRFRFKVAIR